MNISSGNQNESDWTNGLGRDVEGTALVGLRSAPSVFFLGLFSLLEAASATRASMRERGQLVTTCVTLREKNGSTR